ncbi:MAG: MFS transporter [Thermoleophilia bacterium]|nr:MFS transporter [Thermoleophilia bacterium]
MERTPRVGRLRRGVPPALHHRDFAFLWVAIVTMGLAGQMAAVAVGWQVYSISGDPLHLGLIGLAEFLPLPLLAIPAGALADRVSRRLVLAAALVLDGCVALLLVAVTAAGARQLWPFLALALTSGVAGAIGSPAARALPPTLVPTELLAGALAIRSVGAQAAVVTGPALGGLLFALRPELVYATAAALFAVAFVSALAIRPRAGAAARVAGAEPAPRLASLLAGVRFVRPTPILFGAILLDLFAVLFGGAVALLPLFAQDILHTGPVGLGVLRSAPAVGAVVAGLILTRRPLRAPAGRTLLVVVAVFGGSMIVFGLSQWYAVSLAALAVSGFADMYSMNIRSTTVALVTPDELRGRVVAVEMVFISASNELGAFESGVAAALVGAVPAVVLGGAATVLIAAAWPRFFPELARIGRLEDLRPVRARS